MWSKIHIALTVILIGMVGYLGFHLLNKKQVAFVRSQEVLERYTGMEEARALYQKKVDDWGQDLNKHSQLYREKSEAFQAEVSKMNDQQKQSKIAELQRMEVELKQLSDRLQNKAAEEDEKMLQGVLNQVNDLIKQYGEENDIDLILGVTQSGNILYGKDAIDITEDIIKELNKTYTGS